MRIIGGDSKGRIIYLPKQGQMRPTSNGIKESLFNILRTCSGKSFLDLFAGSGNVGLEALSRGAARVVFIEKNAIMANGIKRNLRKLSFGGKYCILPVEATKGMRALRKRGETFDIVFADPPYNRGFVKKILCSLSGVDMFNQDGVLIIQHSIREDTGGHDVSDFILTDRRRHGDTLLSFFKIGEEE